MLSYLACARTIARRARDRLSAVRDAQRAHGDCGARDGGRRGAATSNSSACTGWVNCCIASLPSSDPAFPQVRVYAPVGGHRDLLAYLVRRLLENGANSSFVNRFLDADTPARDVVRDPVTLVARGPRRHPAIRLPAALYGARQAQFDSGWI